jgi:hypothetical protein
MGGIAIGSSKTVNLAFAVQQGIRNAACDQKENGTVSADIIRSGPGSPIGAASHGTSLTKRVTVAVGAVSALTAGFGTIPVTANVPSLATTGATFGVTVALTLVDGS